MGVMYLSPAFICFCACSLLAEGEFIRRTAPVGLLFCLLAQAVGLIFTLGNILPDHPIADTY
jgi:hypothetical protein